MNIIGTDVTAFWYNEIESYDFNRSDVSMQTGHFTQVVWKGSKALGVGIANSKSRKIYVVAQYSPAGNYVGQYKNDVLPARC